MNFAEALLSYARLAFRDPRAAAADVIALGIPREALPPAMFIVVALSVIINAGAEAVAPSPLSAVSPFQMAFIMAVLFVASALAVCKVGQLLGGFGKCSDAVLLVVFFEAIFTPAQALNLLFLAIAPALANVFAIFIIVLGIWVNVNFIAALHGFQGLGRSVAVLLLSSVVVTIAMVAVTVFAGISLFGALPNV